MSYCPDCKQELRIGGPKHDCWEGRQREEKERLARTTCSRSLDVFEDWKQFCRVKITGYTLRNGTDVCRFNFPSGKPNARTTDRMTLLIKQGWQITAIHYENA